MAVRRPDCWLNFLGIILGNSHPLSGAHSGTPGILSGTTPLNSGNSGVQMIDVREVRSQDAGDTSTSSELLGKIQALV